MKRIGILTSGGDCAGLNAVLRAVTFRAIQGYGWEVIGIKQGGKGLMERPIGFQELTLKSFDANVLRMGGTILGSTTKGNPFAYPMPDGSTKDRSGEMIEGFHMLNLDALIGIGGDGSLQILHQFTQKGSIPFIAIPKTIDNDIVATERSIGFSTAVDVATEALDRLQPTAASHDRVMILEVMGRDTGHIALSAGIAGGADVILIPEIPYALENIYKKIRAINDQGRNFALIVVAEAVLTEDGAPSTIIDSPDRTRYGGIGHYLAECIQESTQAETRCTVLGHIQRGGQPDASDRVLAACLGVKAVDLLAEGKFNRMVGWQYRHVIDIPIEQAVSKNKTVNPAGDLVKTARGLGISLGDQ